MTLDKFGRHILQEAPPEVRSLRCATVIPFTLHNGSDDRLLFNGNYDFLRLFVVGRVRALIIEGGKERIRYFLNRKVFEDPKDLCEENIVQDSCLQIMGRLRQPQTNGYVVIEYAPWLETDSPVFADDASQDVLKLEEMKLLLLKNI